MTETVRPPFPEIQERLEFETLIADTSAALLTSSPEELPRAVERALELIREFFRADRCALLTVSDDRQAVHLEIASYSEGVSHVPPSLNLADVFPWSRQRLLVERLPVRIARVADLPPEAAVELPSWAAMATRSALTLPIETGEGTLHLIVLQTVYEEREWPDVYLPRLRVMGELLVGSVLRAAMQRELSGAVARANLAVDAADAGLWELDVRRGVFWASPGARRIFGYGPDEVVTLARIQASVHPDDWDRVRGAIDGALADPGLMRVEYRIPTEDGRVRWVASQGRRHAAAPGTAERVIGISVDVTERRLADEAIHTNERRLAAGAKLAGLAYYEIDYGAGSMIADAGFNDLCGVPPEREGGLQPVEFWLSHLHPEDRERVAEGRRQLHDGRQEQISEEYRYLHPDRGEVWIHHLAGVNVRDAEQRVLQTYGVLRDVTTRKHAEDELRGFSRRLLRAQEAERALIARELHDDLTQRLAVLAIDVGHVERRSRDPAQVHAMQVVREGLVRLSEDVHALAYRLHPAVLEELGLVEALRTECERCGRLGGPVPSIELAEAEAPADPEIALCLFRVAQEALHNVFRHAEARTVSVVLRPMDGGLVLAVRDDGVGFDVTAGDRRPSLGLASMRERVSLVHGSLDIESAPREGTAVVAWVPAGGETR